MNKALFERTSKYTRADESRQSGLYPYFREIQSEQDTEVIIDNRKILMFGSNSYLGLTNHPAVKEAAANAIRKYGSSSCGSRFLNGTLSIHIELEHALEEFLQKEAVLVYSTGFQSNLGVLPSLAGRNDYLLVDNGVHASMIDSSRLTFAKVIRFEHNDFKDLERKVSALNKDCLKFILVDGIYSMEGDITPLVEIDEVARRYNCAIICDDAHAIGVLGDKGMGTGSHFGIHEAVDIQIGTFSKSLASQGGFIASSKPVIEYLKHTSRSLIFSASVTPASAASALAALEIIKNEPEHIANLWYNTTYAIQHLKDLGFDIGKTLTPIIPLFVRDFNKTFILTHNCFKDGIFVNPIIAPAVPESDSMIRISVMATHSKDQINRLIEVLYKNSYSLGIIKKKNSF